jgi:integrase/recombinase XerD
MTQQKSPPSEMIRVPTALIRVSELCGLKWRDLKSRGDGGQITVFGKGEKTRTVLIGAGIWREINSLKGYAKHDDPVFVSAKGGHLCRSIPRSY